MPTPVCLRPSAGSPRTASRLHVFPDTSSGLAFSARCQSERYDELTQHASYDLGRPGLGVGLTQQ